MTTQVRYFLYKASNGVGSTPDTESFRDTPGIGSQYTLPGFCQWELISMKDNYDPPDGAIPVEDVTDFLDNWIKR